MRAHVIKDGKIVNTIEVGALDVLPGLVDASLGGQIGDGWANGKPVLAAPVAVVPERIPMLNAHLELIESGWMPSVNTFIDALPEPDQSLARAYLVQALTMARDHPLVKAFPAATGKTEAEVDELFIRAGARDV